MEYLKNHARRGLSVILGLALLAVAVFALAPRFMNEMAWNGGALRDRMAQQAGNTARSGDTHGTFTGSNQAQAPLAQPNADGSSSLGGPNTAEQRATRGQNTQAQQQGTNQQSARGQNARGDQASPRAQRQQGGRGAQNNERSERRGGHEGGGWWNWLIGSPMQWAGIALIGAGLWFLGRRTSPTPPTPPSEPIHPEMYEPTQPA